MKNFKHILAFCIVLISNGSPVSLNNPTLSAVLQEIKKHAFSSAASGVPPALRLLFRGQAYSWPLKASAHRNNQQTSDITAMHDHAILKHPEQFKNMHLLGIN